MNYAELSDLEAGWRELTAEEAARAETLLARASLFLDGVVEQYNIDTDAKATALMTVCCDLVQRKLEDANVSPYSSVTQTVGSISETVSYSGRKRSWALYPEDLQVLGIGGHRATQIKLAIHDERGTNIEW